MKVFCQFVEFLIVGMDYAIENGSHILTNMNFSTFYSCSKRVSHVMHIAKLLSTLKACGIDSDVCSNLICHFVHSEKLCVFAFKRKGIDSVVGIHDQSLFLVNSYYILIPSKCKKNLSF